MKLQFKTKKSRIVIFITLFLALATIFIIYQQQRFPMNSPLGPVSRYKTDYAVVSFIAKFNKTDNTNKIQYTVTDLNYDDNRQQADPNIDKVNTSIYYYNDKNERVIVGSGSFTGTYSFTGSTSGTNDYPKGKYNLTLEVNPEDSINETNWDNNFAYSTFVVE